MSSIPDRVDVVILGTGLTNSILAAACSRIGKSVLHLDENNYYGNDWASFTFQQLVDWIRSKYPDDKSLRTIPEELTNQSRMFCLDLSPRFLYSNGDMVDLLVKSNVARYHEFKNNIRILCAIGDEIHVMPCRRNEVFTSSLLPNLADKRRLMKFIEMCLSYDSEDSTNEVGELIGLSDKPIGQYLHERGLKPTLQEYIINSIAMMDPNGPTREACKRIKKFMVAIERYGKSPFLFPLYGCGEFPQSFCRLSAVFDGLYCLNTQIKSVKLVEKLKSANLESQGDQPQHPKGSSSENFQINFSDGNRSEHTVKSDIIVLEPSSALNLDLIANKDLIKRDHLSRAILITKGSIVPIADLATTLAVDVSSQQDPISFMRIPPSDRNANLVFLIELNSSALVCPKDYCLVYLWTKATSCEPEHDLKATVERIFKNDDTNRVAWSFYYRQLTRTSSSDQTDSSLTTLNDELSGGVGSSSPTGLFVTGPSCDDIDYASTVREAEQLFKKMCPGEEFLPRAPDPDEIIST